MTELKESELVTDGPTPPGGWGGILAGPRIQFAGTFKTDVSTVNNTMSNYQETLPNQKTWPSYYNKNNDFFSWNPWGSHTFSLDCQVTSVVGPNDGVPITQNDDRVKMIDMHVRTNSNAKLVTLDVSAQEDAAAIWGMTVNLSTNPDPNADPLVSGAVMPSSYRSMWHGTQGQYIRIGGFRALHFSSITVVLADTDMNQLRESNPFLAYMLDSTTKRDTDQGTEYTLLMKFLMDDYNYDPTVHGGMITGIIGTYTSDLLPKTFLVGRHFMPVNSPMSPPTGGRFGYATAAIVTSWEMCERDYLVVDFSNALPKRPKTVQVPTNYVQQYADIGEIIVVPVAMQTNQKYQFRLPVDEYTNPNFLHLAGGIKKFEIEDRSVLDVLNNSPLMIMSVVNENHDPPLYFSLAKESTAGVHAMAEIRCQRMECGGTLDLGDLGDSVWGGAAAYRIFVMQFGRPVSRGAKVGLLDSVISVDDGAGGTYQLDYPIELAPAISKKGEISSPISNPENGSVDLVITAPDTLEVNGVAPRGTYNLDSLMYQVDFEVVDEANQVLFRSSMSTSSSLQILVFGRYDIPETPTWTHDVQEALHFFHLLYPIMQRKFNLNNYDQVVAKAAPMKDRMSAERFYTEGFMPVTRDLADAKRRMILKWIDNPLE